MRQRKVKNQDEKLEALSKYAINEPKEMKGCWSEFFGNNNPIFLEIGSGKGQFITTLAKENPDKNFIGCDTLFSSLVKYTL